MKEYQIEERGEKTTIIVNGRRITGIKIPKRSGSGFHSTEPKRCRTRSSNLRKILEEQYANI
jgi:hypothetical protein